MNDIATTTTTSLAPPHFRIRQRGAFFSPPDLIGFRFRLIDPGEEQPKKKQGPQREPACLRLSDGSRSHNHTPQSLRSEKLSRENNSAFSFPHFSSSIVTFLSVEETDWTEKSSANQ